MAPDHHQRARDHTAGRRPHAVPGESGRDAARRRRQLPPLRARAARRQLPRLRQEPQGQRAPLPAHARRRVDRCVRVAAVVISDYILLSLIWLSHCTLCLIASLQICSRDMQYSQFKANNVQGNTCGRRRHTGLSFWIRTGNGIIQRVLRDIILKPVICLKDSSK